MAKHTAAAAAESPKSSSPFDALRIARRGNDAAAAADSQPVKPLESQTAKPLDSQTVKQVASQAAEGLAKSGNPDYMKFTTYVKRKTHLAVKSRLVAQERELSDLVEELLENWLRNSPPVQF